VRSLAEATEAFDAPLAALGLTRAPCEADDVPAGRIDPPTRWAKRLWSRRTGAERIDLHVRVAGSPNERLALLFRDWFRAHPAVAPIRTDARDPLLDLLIVTAEAWADRTGWQP
jgi:dephospho-CoA kinase